MNSTQSPAKVNFLSTLVDVAEVGMKVTGFALAFAFAAALVSLGIYGEVASFLLPVAVLPLISFLVALIAGVTVLLLDDSDEN